MESKRLIVKYLFFICVIISLAFVSASCRDNTPGELSSDTIESHSSVSDIDSKTSEESVMPTSEEKSTTSEIKTTSSAVTKSLSKPPVSISSELPLPPIKKSSTSGSKQTSTSKPKTTTSAATTTSKPPTSSGDTGYFPPTLLAGEKYKEINKSVVNVKNLYGIDFYYVPDDIYKNLMLYDAENTSSSSDSGQLQEIEMEMLDIADSQDELDEMLENIRLVEAELVKYPDGFFREIEQKTGRKMKINFIKYVFVDGESGMVGAYIMNDIGDNEIFLASRIDEENSYGYKENTDQKKRSFHHEIMHAIQFYMLHYTDKFIVDYMDNIPRKYFLEWNIHNPYWFSYIEEKPENADSILNTMILGGYVFNYYQGDNVYFATPYSLFGQAEDISELFADMMVNPPRYFYSTSQKFLPIQEKIDRLHWMLNEAFDCVKPETVEYWETQRNLWYESYGLSSSA